ncbi:MAG: mevalonate kinase [Anaerolineae bacterium]|jgi:mevalonate kinase|nr:mevalonate kinase [Anaerolineae bacterium]
MSFLNSIRTSAPAKIILFGEHAVVYGQPALAVPVTSLGVTVEAVPDTTTIIEGSDLLKTLPANVSHNELLDPLLRMVASTAAHFGQRGPAMRFTINSTIPVASGLGSGAAVSAALGRAVAAALGHTIPNESLNALVYEVERIHHGTPSGIDNTVIVYAQPVYFIRGQSPTTFTVGAPIHLLIADTGVSALTRESVGDVRKLTETDPQRAFPLIEAVGDVVRAAHTALMQGDTAKLGGLMLENHRLLQQLTVSSTELDSLVAAALDAGALGAKLSGGGRGGNMIALVTPETEQAVAQALIRTGAVRVIPTTLTPPA